MTLEEARLLIVEGINYAAYKETDSSLYDSDKNRLLGSEHYKSGREIVEPSPWAEGDFEEKMATLLRWANTLNRSDLSFAQSSTLQSWRRSFSERWTKWLLTGSSPNVATNWRPWLTRCWTFS